MAKKTKAATAAKKIRERAILAKPASMTALLDADAMGAAVEQMRATLDTYTRECSQLRPNAEMPQHLIVMAHLAHEATATLSKLYRAFEDTAATLRRKGKFEPGPCEVVFVKQPGRRSVAWKEEAVRNAARVAELRGRKFSEKRYVDRVMSMAEPGPDTFKPHIEVRGVG